MADFNLDDIRLKDADELSDEERDFLRENKDELTDEELESFGDVLTEEKDEEEEDKHEDEEKEEEEEKGFSFESEEDFIEKTSRVFERVLEKREKKTDTDTEKKETDRIFPEGFKPRDWEEAGQKIHEAWERKQKAMADELKRKADEINREWDNQLADLRIKNPNLPKAGTKEGASFDQELSGIIAKYKGVTNMNEAYEIWEAKHGGGKGGENQKDVSGKQKDLVKKIGKSSAGEEEKKQKKYQEIAGKDMDDAEEAALRRWKELS